MTVFQIVMLKGAWSLEGSGVFLVKSLYRHATFRGVTSIIMQKIWKSGLPLKNHNLPVAGFSKQNPFCKKGSIEMQFEKFRLQVRLLACLYVLVQLSTSRARCFPFWWLYSDQPYVGAVTY